MRKELILDERFAGQVEQAHVIAEVQAGEVNGHTRGALADECHSHRGTDADPRRGRGVFDHLHHALLAENGIGLEHHRPRPPLDAGKRCPFRRLLGGDHRGVDALGEQRAVRLATIVVFSGSDVASAAGEIHMRHAIVARAPLACDAHEIARDHAVAVVAHRVGGVVIQRGQFAPAIPEGDGLEHRINGALRLLTQRRVLGGARAHADDLALRAHDAAVGGDLFDFRLAVREVRQRLGTLERCLDAGRHSRQRTLRPRDIDHTLLPGH